MLQRSPTQVAKRRSIRRVACYESAKPPQTGTNPLTDRIAFVLGSVIVAAIAADILANDSAALLFLLRKFADMVEWMAFWR